MNVTIFRSQLVALSNCLIKHKRTLCILNSYKNIATSNELINTRTDLYCCAFNLNKINKFSTTNAVLKSKSKIKSKNQVHVDVHELGTVIDLDQMMSKCEKAVESFKENLIKYAALRSNVGAIESLPITYENKQYDLAELVEISRKPKMVVLNVDAFPQIIPNILEVLRKSQMNLNPQQEGTTIYVPIPKITKEHRENIAKNAKQYFVKCKDIIGDISKDYIKKLKKSNNEDLVFNGEKYIHAVQQEYVAKAKALLDMKQKEVLGES